ncbi:unnamed protein product, partial [Sphacelaria rigidula]
SAAASLHYQHQQLPRGRPREPSIEPLHLGHSIRGNSGSAGSGRSMHGHSVDIERMRDEAISSAAAAAAAGVDGEEYARESGRRSPPLSTSPRHHSQHDPSHHHRQGSGIHNRGHTPPSSMSNTANNTSGSFIGAPRPAALRNPSRSHSPPPPTTTMSLSAAAGGGGGGISGPASPDGVASHLHLLGLAAAATSSIPAPSRGNSSAR